MKLIQNKVATASICLALLCGAPTVWASPLEAEQTAPTVRVTGTVTDETGEPLIGANVVVKGQTRGVNTDIDGNFTLDVEPGQTLVVSYIGCLPQEVVVKDAGHLDIKLSENATMLEEVVAIGYGVQKKKLVTGATVQVKGEDVAKMNTTNVLTAMQSTSPGVQITQSSSQPGKGFKVNIRGMGTIGDSSPLLIIDGINSGTADDGLNGLNPNDIESIDILKDAASCAIYGARAANGVILVTTKQGQSGKVTVQYDANFGWSNAYRVPGVLNAQQYMQIINETNFNTYGTTTNWSSLVPQSILDRVNNGWEGTDWFDLYRNKNAFQMNHSLTVSGGSDVSKFSISINYSKNEGIMGGDNASDYSRYGGRINSEHIVLKNKDHSIITLGENLSYWYNSSHDLPESNGYWNIMQNVYSASPLVPAYREDGSVASYDVDGAGFSTNIYSNPLNGFLNGQYNSLNRSRNFGIGATFYWIIEPIKNLRYRGQINTGYSASNYRAQSLPFSMSSTAASGSYGLQQTESQSSSMSFENTITYILPSFGKNNIDLMIGQSFERSNWSTGLSMTASDVASSVNSLVLNGWDYAVMSNFSNITGYSGYDNPKQGSISSFFGRVNYNFDEKYLLTAIVRRDGSSNFAKGHRWGTFPSVSLGWVISNEKFLENATETMDFLKLRASWGQNGNCNISNFYYLSNIGFSPTDYADYGYKFSSDMINTVNGSYTTGAYAKNVPNEDVTWEKSEQWNVGLDARFLRSRLGMNLDFYIKKTKDWLVQAPLNDILGYEEAAYINGGDVENKGVEIAFSWNDRIGSDFNYHINVNAAYNHNEVTRLATSSGKIGDDVSSALFQNSSYVSLVEVGHPIGYFSGMDYTGVWQTQEQIDAARAAGQAVLDNAQPGDLMWIDWNGDGQITLDGDRHEIGDPNPDWTLGINLGANWKGFDFSIAGSGAFGQQIMQCYRTALLANQYLQYTTDVLDRWHGAGTSNTNPRLTVGGENNQWVSTYYMHNADYFKIQNITIGYDFKRIWKSCPFQTLRLYGQVQNLHTFTSYKGVDPECGSNGGTNSWAKGIDLGLYPTARTWLFGVSIKY
ncbi:MAG: TonB-dependent receptor [Bacteroidales bacterium]|nr:TonB-dependent receptor [Bacteroidales bacterium]